MEDNQEQEVEEPQQNNNYFAMDFEMPSMNINDIIDTSMLPSF